MKEQNTEVSTGLENLKPNKIFTLNGDQWGKFQKRLEAKPKDKPALPKLLLEPGAFA